MSKRSTRKEEGGRSSRGWQESTVLKVKNVGIKQKLPKVKQALDS